MVENIDFSSVVGNLSAEFDALIDERRELLEKINKFTTRTHEIERKLKGIQQTLQGLSLYTTAQEAPTEVTKKTTRTINDMLSSMQKLGEMSVEGPEVPKTLSECCRDILRKRADWMSAVHVREALNAAGFDFSNYTSNPLSSIHTTLKRLAQDEVETQTQGDGQVYRWKKQSKTKN